MGLYSTLKGIASLTLQLGKGGIKIKNNSGVFEPVAADGSTLVNGQFADAYATNVIAGTASVAGTLIAFGDANKVSFAYAASQSDDTTYTWVKPDAGKFLTTDASGNLSWSDVPVESLTDIAHVATKAFDKDTTSPFDHKLLPIGAIVLKTQVIIDTPFDGTAPVIKIGKAGTTDKYLAESENDLLGAAGDVYEAIKGNAAVSSSPEQTICTFDADESENGAGRVLIHFIIPEVVA